MTHRFLRRWKVPCQKHKKYSNQYDIYTPKGACVQLSIIQHFDVIHEGKQYFLNYVLPFRVIIKLVKSKSMHATLCTYTRYSVIKLWVTKIEEEEKEEIWVGAQTSVTFPDSLSLLHKNSLPNQELHVNAQINLTRFNLTELIRKLTYDLYFARAPYSVRLKA
jgi:hypothetical protein